MRRGSKRKGVDTLPTYIKDMIDDGVTDLLAPIWRKVGNKNILYVKLEKVGSYSVREGEFVCNRYKSVSGNRASASYVVFDNKFDAENHVLNTPEGCVS